MRILHLEDKPLDSELAANSLRKGGVSAQIDRVVTLSDFAGALTRGGYALVLADYTVPGVDPLEALRLARKMCPEVPFLFLTGTIGEEAAIETLKIGATDYVLKQNIGRLVPAVRRALQEFQEQARRREAEAALRCSEQRFRVAQELSLDAFTILRAVRDASGCIIDFRWEYVNPAAGRLLRRRPEDLTGQRLLQVLFGNKVNSDLFDRYVRVVETGEPHDYELPYESEGIRGWFRNMTVKLEDGIAVYFADITERKDAEEALLQAKDEASRRAKEAEERERIFLAMMDHIPMGITIADAPDVTIRAVSRYGRELTGQPRDEIEGIPVDLHVERWHIFRSDGVTPATNEELPLTRATQQGEVVREEEFVIGRPDGTKVPILCTAAPIYDAQGNITGGVIGWQDISELKRLNESLERRVNERTALAEQQAAQLRILAAELTRAEESERRRISHTLHEQLQQLLVGVRMKLALLHRKIGSEAAQPMFEEVHDLVNQAITETRLLTLELSPPVLYAGGLAAGLEWLAGHTKDRYGLSIEVHAEKAAEPIDEGVQLFLFHAVRELVLNIVKHARAESARIELTRASGKWLRLAVADTGVGLSPSQLEHLERSSGFGLFSIRERLKAMGGIFGVDSAPGQGTRITLELPARSVRRPKAAKGPGPASEAGAEGTAEGSLSASCEEILRVLIADDHAVVRRGMAEFLSGHGRIEIVGEAANGREAIEMALELHPDIVLMDVTMPVMDGIEATRRIRQALPGVRVIGLSMHEEPAVAGAMYKAGAVAYLPKHSASEAVVSAILAQRP